MDSYYTHSSTLDLDLISEKSRRDSSARYAVAPSAGRRVPQRHLATDHFTTAKVRVGPSSNTP